MFKNYKDFINENVIMNESNKYSVEYSDGIRGSSEFKREMEAISFAKDLIKTKKGLQFVSVHKPGMSQTAHKEDLLAWWGPGSFWDNKAKKDKTLYDIQIDESRSLLKSESILEKVSGKTIDNLTDEIAKITKQLKDNFKKFKSADAKGNEQDKIKYIKIAGTLTTEKKILDGQLEREIQSFGSDMELDLAFESKLTEARLKGLKGSGSGLKSDIMKKWTSTDDIMDDLRLFINAARDAGGEDLVKDIHDSLRLMKNYALGMAGGGEQSDSLKDMKYGTNEMQAESNVHEAAPKMSKDSSVQSIEEISAILSRVENGMRAFNQSRYSNLKNDFKKVYKALDGLKLGMFRHSAIPENAEVVNEGQNNPVDKKFIRAWEKLCSAMIGRLKIDMRQAPVESKFLFTKNIKRIEDVLDIPTEISYFTEGKVNEGKIDIALNKMDEWLPEDPDAMERYYEIINQEGWKDMEEFFIEYGNESVLQSYGLKQRDMKKLAQAAMENYGHTGGAQLNEEYIELMQIDEPLDALKAAWENWRQGPATNYEDVPPAYKELEKYVAKWLKKNLR